ncbi:MAG TPA: low molecular weight protein-tyrosine-phosphatase [Sporolactobacillaceae bacterium]|nr:low molecular weight protein-tyrosine-phosphatase [Sporolactobacillaceae bacterium]
MIRVLFVCLGNICRSPMAEAVFRDLVRKKGLEDKIEVDSAGTGNWHVGASPHEGTQKLLREKGIDFSTIKAREFLSNDFGSFDYIIGMDRQNVLDMEKRAPKEGKTVTVTRLMDERLDLEHRDVPDPWYTGDFNLTYDLVKAGAEALLDRIIKEHHLEGKSQNESHKD